MIDNDGNDADHIVMMMVITVMVHLQCFNGHYVIIVIVITVMITMNSVVMVDGDNVMILVLTAVVIRMMM